MTGTNPPRNVIYYNSDANQIPLAGIANLLYTDVIVAFLVPDNNLNLIGNGGAFNDNLQNNIQALQNANKNVLISVGGSTFPSSAWQSYAQDVNGLVKQLVSWVTMDGFNGVDIDYEDDAGFTGTYDGVGFLSALTSGLAQALPAGQNIITHAPQTPYWDPDARYDNAYTQIWQQVGNQITWINNQFYNNKSYDHDAALKVLWYRNIAAITGSKRLLVGAPVASGATSEGYIGLHDTVQHVVKPLQSNFGAQFGGMMGWQFSHDQAGDWGTGIGAALPAPQPAQHSLHR
jgi:chitinase